MTLAEKIEKVLHYSEESISREGVFIPNDVVDDVHLIRHRYFELLSLSEPDAAVLARVEYIQRELDKSWGEIHEYRDKLEERM